MFKKLFDKIMAAPDADKVYEVMAEADMLFQREKISWDDHERLFSLGARLMANYKFVR